MKSGSYTPILVFIVLAAFVYIAVLRPQRKRQAQSALLQKTLAPGAEVMTTAGLYGTVVDVADDVVTLEVAPGVTHRYVRAAIAKVLPPAADAGVDPDTEARADDYPATEPGGFHDAENGYPEVGEAAYDDVEADVGPDEHGSGSTPGVDGTARDRAQHEHDGGLDEPPSAGRPNA